MSSKNKKRNKSVKRRQIVVSHIRALNNETIVPKEGKDVNSSKSYFEVDAIKKTQKGIDYFSTEFTLAQLASLTHVDNYDSDNPDVDGRIQRTLNEPNARKFMNFIIKNDNVCFLELLINDRSGEYIEFTTLQQMGINIPQFAKIATTHGVLKIPANAKLYVYDGQTRRFGYLSLLHFELEMLGSAAFKEYKHMKIPVCISQVSASEEAKLFLMHNKQASVSNDHKAMVLFHTHKDGTDIQDHTYSEKQRSIVAGLVDNLNKDRTGPWYNQIAQPDDSKIVSKSKMGCQAGFNQGLKSFIAWLNRNYWSAGTTYGVKSKDLADICTIFWKSVKVTCPKIWKQPELYIQLRSQGISSLSMLMHVLYIDFFERNLEWNISNLVPYLKRSSIMTTPKKWEVGGDLSKKGGNYKALEDVKRDIYDQIRMTL